MKLESPLACPRVRLREHVASDLDAYHAWRGDPEVMRFLSWRSRSREESRASLAEAIREQSNPGRTKYFLAIEAAADAEIAGDVGLELAEDGAAGLGWFLRPEFQDRGLATEAAVRLISFASEILGVGEIVASCDAMNTPSERVMQKCGMTLARRAPRASRPGTRLHYHLNLRNGDGP